MAYINGNKPIVTNGLVYALDFGNQKSYNSGSNRAVSLAYDPTVTIVTGSTKAVATGISQGIPAYLSGVLSFTGSQFIQRTSSLGFLNQNSSFTISYVALPKTEGTIVSQKTTAGVFNIQLAPTQSQIGFYYDNQSYSRLFTFPSSSNFRYFTYRFDSGSFDCFINGVPVTSSNPNAPIQNYEDLNTLYIGMQTGETRGISGSLANFFVYNRALTADEIYSNYSVFAGRFGMPVVSKPYTLDEDVYQYVQSTGITDSNTQNAISTFVSGLKTSGLWNKLVAVFPFLGSNTASQAANLKEPASYPVSYTGSWTVGSFGSTGTATSYGNLSVAPTTLYTDFNSSSAHLTYLSYDLPQTSSYLVGAVSYMSASGGQITFSGSRTYHVFTSSATFSVFQPGAVEILAVAGGGGTAFPGDSGGGGGGAGGVVYQTTFTLPSGSIIVTVGSGGAAKNSGVSGNGNNGENTTIGSLVAVGGGGGGRGGVGNAGGSSGGNRGTSLIAGQNVPGQGNLGGLGGNVGDGGGGGGSGQFGRSVRAGGQGGSGSYFPQFLFLNYGDPIGWFGGGGGGGSGNGVGGINYLPPGGPGGGGRGGHSSTKGISGSVNTGGGGGGTWDHQPSGSDGGSGIVIISYPTVATSSFGLKITETSLTGSLNSPESSAITASGNIGLVTVSRKQAGILSLHKNNISASFGTAGEFLPFPNLYLNAANNAGTASGITPSTISYASIGAGLTTSEVATYHNLVSQLQANLKRQNTLLDNYTGAAAAYSLRRIGPSSYFGPAIRVRRDSDNTLRDIGFTSDGQLDTVGLLDFVGVTGSGFVQTWYDQSGNGYDMSQSTTTAQPWIITSGSLLQQQNKPAVLSPSASFTYLSATPYQATDFSTFTVLNVLAIPTTPDAQSYAGYYRTIPSTGDGFNIVSTNVNTSWRSNIITYTNNVNQKTYSRSSNKALPTNPYLEEWHYLRSNESRFLYENSATQSVVNTGEFSHPTGVGSYMWLGYQGKNRMVGYIQELISYNSYQLSNRTPIASNITTHYTTGSDTDYQAFITATGITQPTQSAALETLVSDLKSYGLWSKMKAIYPMVTDKNNRFAYSQALGTTWNATNVYVTQSFTTAPDGTSTGNFVSESAVADTHFIYQTISDGLVTGSEYVASIYGKFLNRPWIAMETNTGAKAWFNIQTGITGSLTGSNATITAVSGGWYRCALYFTSSVASGPQNIQYNLADANGNLTYAGVAGTGSYLWGAQFENGNVLGPYRATTSTGFTTGSMLDQMKFNLKNPADTDAAFRLTYLGNWHPGYSGNRPNGLTGTYANTFLNASSSFTGTSQAFGIYTNINVPIVSQDKIPIAASTGTSYSTLNLDSVSSNRYAYIGEHPNGRLFFTTTGTGMFIVNRTTPSLMKIHKNSSIIATNTNTIIALPSTQFTLGAQSNSYPSNHIHNLTFMSEGLTDYEAKALYWIVQKYQTTLGRQVY